MQEFRAIGAAGVVMDARTGELLAMVSRPTFDPERPAAAADEARFNRASLGIYEMGSVFKIFTTAMALDRGVVSLIDGYDVSEPIHVARYTIRDFHPMNRWLSVPDRTSTRLNSSHSCASRMPSSACKKTNHRN